ncbi:hypothetical protein OROGR_032607 [Orobanche gracilis]
MKGRYTRLTVIAMLLTTIDNYAVLVQIDFLTWREKSNNKWSKHYLSRDVSFMDLVEFHSILFVQGRLNTEWRYGESLDRSRSNCVLFALNIQMSSVMVAVKIVETCQLIQMMGSSTILYWIMDSDVLPRQNAESDPENGDALHPAAKYSADRDGNDDLNACSVLNFCVILKKLLDLGKVGAKDLASEIGVPPDSLDTILTDNHMVPGLQCKLFRWLENHAYISNLQKKMKLKTRSLVPEDVVDVAEAVESDCVPVKSVPPRKRTKSSIRAVKDEKSCSSKDKTNGRAPGGGIPSSSSLLVLMSSFPLSSSSLDLCHD